MAVLTPVSSGFSSCGVFASIDAGVPFVIQGIKQGNSW